MPMWMLKRAFEELGVSRSTGYVQIDRGLIPAPVKVSTKKNGIDSDEVLQIKRARLARKTEDEIRDLVRRIESARLLPEEPQHIGMEQAA